MICTAVLYFYFNINLPRLALAICRLIYMNVVIYSFVNKSSNALQSYNRLVAFLTTFITASLISTI